MKCVFEHEATWRTVTPFHSFLYRGRKMYYKGVLWFVVFAKQAAAEAEAAKKKAEEEEAAKAAKAKVRLHFFHLS